MQLLLRERLTLKISPLEFVNTITELYYSMLAQTALRDVFPVNCHHNAAVNSLSLESMEYQYLLSGCADLSIKLWDLKAQEEVKGDDEDPDWRYRRQYEDYDYDNPRQVFTNIATVPRKTAHTFGISSIMWWPFDTGIFVSASFDHTVKIWDTQEMAPVHEFDIANRVYLIDIRGHQPNEMTASALIAVASDQPFIRLLDIRAGSSAHTLSGHKGKTLEVKWHPTNPFLFASGGFDGEVKVWDIRRSNNCLCRLDMLKTSSLTQHDSHNLTKTSVKAHLGPVNGLVWDESGTTLFTAGNDDKVRCWDVASSLAPPINRLINFGPLTRNKYPQTIPILLSSKLELELQYLLFPSDNDDVFVYRTIDGKLLSRLSRRGSKNHGRTSSMCYAGPSSGTYFCGTMDGEIVTWVPSWPTSYDRQAKLELKDVLDRSHLVKEANEILANDPFLQKSFPT